MNILYMYSFLIIFFRKLIEKGWLNYWEGCDYNVDDFFLIFLLGWGFFVFI